jgi:hypothetical protein
VPPSRPATGAPSRERNGRGGRPVSLLTGVRIEIQELREAAVAAALDRAARRARKRARAREARAAGRRSLTVCGRWTGTTRIPDLRLSGWWLRAAGFDLGQACEVEVLAGTLVVRAV